METRKYKGTGEELSLLGFGFMRLPTKTGPADIDTAQATEMVDYALSKGVNYFDTAYMYHEGMSEVFAGEVLSWHDRGKFNLASKMPLVFVKTEADVEKNFQEQLKKCKTDYFDFYLLHNINREHLKVTEAFRVYEKLKEKQKRGQIRRLGFSFHGQPELLKEVTEKYDWDFAQIQLNYLDWEQQNAKEQYNILTGRGIPVNVMEQVQDNVQTMETFKPLSDQEYQMIDKALVAFKTSGTVPSTGCRYCMDCPQGIDIPKVLAIYNNYLFGKARNRPITSLLFTMEYRILGEEKQAYHCVQCNQCSGKCPQHIDIPHWMIMIIEIHQALLPKK